MKITNKILPIILLCMLLASCNKDNTPYGSEYEINGIELKTNDSSKDTISASQFVIKMLLKSDNKYAEEYGLEPRLKSKISDIKVEVLSDGLHPSIAKNDDVSRFFVIDDQVYYDENDYYNYYKNGLYITIPEYVSRGVIKSLKPVLYFTNQTRLAPKADVLITDTLALAFKVELKLENNRIFSDQISTVLIP